MKKKITKIFGVGLTIVLAASLLFSAAPVSAGTLSWGAESVPTTTGNVITDNTSMNIVDIAVADDGTMYLVTGETNQCYKSTNGGVTWSTLSKNFSNPLTFVTVAPDDSDYVGVVEGTTPKVWISTDGGSTWGDLSTPTETVGGFAHTIVTIEDFTMSTADGSKHYLAIAGTTGAAGNATGIWDVLYFDLGAAAPKWNSTREDGGSPAALVLDVALAVEFSPNVASDAVMAVVAADTGTDVMFQLYSLSTKIWNDPFNITATEIQDSGSSISATGAALTLAPDYLGSDDSLRIAFVGLETGGADAGVYRLKDTTDKEINEGSGNDVFSIDYDGTNLVAGSAIDDKVWRSDDALASSPNFSTTTSTKRPGGAGSATTNVIVAWNGADVVAGCTGTGSAFAVSTDNGKSFNDISFIDMNGHLGSALDVAVSADGSKIYLLVAGDSGISLFRKASSWQRVFAGANLTGNDGIIRVAPDDPDAIYIAEEGGKTIYFSSEGGDTKWFKRTSKETIGDLAVESADVSYVAVSGAKTVSKSTNSGFTWGSGKDTGVGGSSIDTIRSLGEDNVIVGSDSYVAWSTDGNSSWSDINTPLNATGLTQVTASGLGDGDYIYAATSANSSRVERWEIGQSGSSWKNLEAPTSGNYTWGIALADGVLYVVTNDDKGDSFLIRTLSPTSSEPSSGMWSTVKSAAEIFTAAPSALRASSGSTKLWAVHSAVAVAKPLFSYTDAVATEGPSLSAPGDGADIKVNPVSGSTYTVPLTWERLSKSKIYDYQVSLDSGFVEKVINTSTSSTTSSTPSAVISGDNFMPGTTYYWRIRTNIAGPVRSPWSETRSFTITELPEALPPVVIQQPPAPVIQVPPAPSITLQPPEIVLPAPPPAPPEIVIPAAPAPTPPIPAWALYVIIIIGAVLVIALIVLIMRTRRPV